MRSVRPLAAHRAFVAALVAAMFAAPGVAAAQAPVASIWYRGTPAGTPQQSELGAIRALGFQGITWPSAQTAGLRELNRLAGIVGLRVVVADRPVPLSTKTVMKPLGPERVDIVISPSTSSLVTPLAWSAIARGARAIAFDSGSKTGAGLEEKDGSLKPWARAAISVARQLDANANLVALLQPGPRITVGPAEPNEDVVYVSATLLDAGRAWVVIATNSWNRKATASIRLPQGVPYALWVSWLGGPPLAMISEPAGPRWMVTMAPRSAQVYIIDKDMK